MKRKEQIQNAAADHRDWVCCGFIDPIADAREASFIEGAEWADKTMIDKACKWLRSNVIIPKLGITFNENDFRKAMEK